MRARTGAIAANGGFVEPHPPFSAENRFLKAKLDVYRNISASLDLFSGPAENISEDIPQIKVPALLSSLPLKTFGKIRKIKTSKPSSCGTGAVGEDTTVRIILRAFFFIRQNIISFADFLKPALIPSLLIRMIFMGELSEGFFYIILAGVSQYPQCFVIIFFHNPKITFFKN